MARAGDASGRDHGRDSGRGDPFDLERFVSAQQSHFATALAELRAGSKRTHWMWFVFPQMAGLGSSSTSAHYAIRSREEARCYLEHPVLGPRLRECAEALLAVHGRTASAILGYPDVLKLKSSMTLFAGIEGPGSVFERVLAKYYDGRRCERTLELLRRAAPGS
jgi:uncharacterized protein (DUF1810 family)